MSNYFDEDFEIGEEQEYKGIRFCPDCQNMLHPKDNEKKLAFECLSKNCPYTIEVEDSESHHDNLVSKKEFQKEKNVIVDAEFALDPTMPREQTNCPECNHNEAVFFISSDIEDTKIVLVYICCNRECGNFWRKTNEE